MFASDPALPSPPDREAIRARARAEGFLACGFAAPHVPPLQRARLASFVALGQHGTMDWMARRSAERADPTALWPAVKTVICLGYGYGPDHNPLSRLDQSGRANVSAYAWGRDYHRILKQATKRLARWLEQGTGAQVKVFVDTAPVAEKPLAQRAGIGWQGKHTNLVSGAQGSWLFLAEIFTDLRIDPDPPARDQCGSCTRCLDICPTQAFPTPYTLDARRCLAYLSIEHEGPIPEELRQAMGNRIYGCDDCLAVCPWNKFASQTQDARLVHPEIRDLTLAQALSLDEAAFRSLFGGSPIKRIKWHRWIRNALIVAGNADATAWAQVQKTVQNFMHHDDPVLRESAAWALAKHRDLGPTVDEINTHTSDDKK